VGEGLSGKGVKSLFAPDGVAEKTLDPFRLQGYILRHRPEWEDDLSLEIKVLENHGRYEVRWEIPKGWLGGGPVVVIDKRTKQVLKAYHER
jgi:hypothetical protein